MPENQADTNEAEIRVVHLSGRLGLKAEQDLEKLLVTEINNSATRILLNMEDVEFVSSSGLRALMQAYKHAAAVGKKVAMAHVRPGVYKIFKLTASVDLFHIFEEQAAAQDWLSK